MPMQALVMGFGGTGAHILTFLKEQTVSKFGKKPDNIKFLLFDTIAHWEPGAAVPIAGAQAEEILAQGSEEGTSLDEQMGEYFPLKDPAPDLATHIHNFLSNPVNLPNYPQFKDWLHAGWLRVHVPRDRLNLTAGAAQQRMIGRYAMFKNAPQIRAKIAERLQSLLPYAGQGALNIWIIGSAAGGTGAGCLLDAAYLTRLAAGGNRIALTGVIVFPEIYQDYGVGISNARAYSLFRELERLQRVGIPDRDRFEVNQLEVLSKVEYDANRLQVATTDSRLFDYLFYLGTPCRGDDARRAFFTSVANAVDPYLDEGSASPLLTASLNDFGAASSMGAARVYIPKETLAAIFAYEQARYYLKSAGAPREDEVRTLWFGAIEDRQRQARIRINNLLPLFSSLQQLANQTDDQKTAFAKKLLSPRTIVMEWYQFANFAAAGMQLNAAEMQDVKLTFINPYFSLVEEDEKQVEPKEIILKTYDEKHKAGEKETKSESASRFTQDLNKTTTNYKGGSQTQKTFAKGRKLVFDKISELMRNKIDGLVISELAQNPQVARDPNQSDQGTTLTRIYQEISWIVGHGGPLANIKKVIGTYREAMEAELPQLVQRSTNAVSVLEQSKPGTFGGMGPVVANQVQVRQQNYEAVKGWQKQELLEDMQKLVDEVINRFKAWHRLLKETFDGMVLEPDSALSTAIKRLDLLYNRLYRQALNPTSLISLQNRIPHQPPDTTMQGYRQELENLAISAGAGAGTWAEVLLANSRWQAQVVDGQPSLTLVITQDGLPVSKSPTEMRKLPDGDDGLYRYFREKIDDALEEKDIFDFLLFLQNSLELTAAQIAAALNQAASVLLQADVPEEWVLVYQQPTRMDKATLITAIGASLANTLTGRNPDVTAHSDKNSLTLMKFVKPNLIQIHNLNTCRGDYLREQQESLPDRQSNFGHYQELQRSLVYHPFRSELEASYIERSWSLAHHQGLTAADHIPTRIARLLEDPAMMQAFIFCLATGAVERVDGIWVWHAPGGDLELTTPQEYNADLVRAAVLFVMQRRPGIPGSRRNISYNEAIASARTKAGSDQALRAAGLQLRDNQLDIFLNQHFSLRDHVDPTQHQREWQALKMVLEFYCDPKTSPELAQRTYD